MKSLVVLFFTTIACLSQAKVIWNFLLGPLPKGGSVQIINVSPTESLLIDFKVALIAGIIIASPWIFLQIYSFIAPGLLKKEKSLILPLVFFSVLFLVIGATFSFYIVIPTGLFFLESYGSGTAQQQWTQVNYGNFIVQLILAFGIMFQLPVVSWFFARLNLISAKFLWSQFRFAVLIIFIISAMLTPPEVISMVLLALPLILLYLFSIGVVALTNPDSKKHEDPGL
jgi:sec-independent protein translocase protein TatC